MTISLELREPALRVPGAVDRLITLITDAAAAVLGEHVREHVQVLVLAEPAA